MNPWALWIFSVFWDGTNREVWLFLWGGNSWEQDRWRRFISVIKKILRHFSHGKKWKFLHLGAKMSSVFLQYLSVRHVNREKAKIKLKSQSYTVTLHQFINVNRSSHWNLWRPMENAATGLLRAQTCLVATECLKYFIYSSWEHCSVRNILLWAMNKDLGIHPLIEPDEIYA